MTPSVDSSDDEHVIEYLPGITTHGFEGAELALWKCWALTGEDVSEGPCVDWHTHAVAAVAEMRHERDEFASYLDNLVTQAETARRHMKDIL